MWRMFVDAGAYCVRRGLCTSDDELCESVWRQQIFATSGKECEEIAQIVCVVMQRRSAQEEYVVVRDERGNCAVPFRCACAEVMRLVNDHEVISMR